MRPHKKTLYITSILLIITFILLLPYFLSFYNGKLSDNNQDWGAFGGYLSGIISVINLFIFIYISFLIHKFNMDKDVQDVKNQKLITLTHFRQAELESLLRELDKTTASNGYEKKDIIISRFSYTSIYLTNFFNQKNHLFPILHEEKLLSIHSNIENLIIQKITLIKKLYGVEKTKEETQMLENLFIEFQEAKTELLNVLQEYIIQELE